MLNHGPNTKFYPNAVVFDDISRSLNVSLKINTVNPKVLEKILGLSFNDKSSQYLFIVKALGIDFVTAPIIRYLIG